MSDVRITAFRVIDAEPRPNGDRIVASFDCEAHGIFLNRLGLLRKADGEIRITVPRDRSDRPFVGFSDAVVANCIVAVAKRALAGLT